MNETFMKEKPVFSLLVSMAFPMVISMLVNSLYNIVDSYFVAKISEDAMIITRISGTEFYQCCRYWFWRWNECGYQFLFGCKGL